MILVLLTFLIIGETGVREETFFSQKLIKLTLKKKIKEKEISIGCSIIAYIPLLFYVQ